MTSDGQSGLALNKPADHFTLADIAADLGLSDSLITQLGVLWGKSAARCGGRTHLLLGHMVDTAMVAERMWLEFLAPRMKQVLERVSGGDGLRFFVWLCGLHDWGKAVPAFQRQDANSAASVRAAGLSWDESRLRSAGKWRHEKAGAVLVTKVFSGWRREHVDWLWPLIGGHHGRFPTRRELNVEQARKHPHGVWAGSPWPEVQRAIAEVYCRALGYHGIDDAEPLERPSKADQLAISGLIVMADWIASDQHHFSGLDSLEKISVGSCRSRAAAGWAALGLRGGWGRIPVPAGEPIAARFGDAPRESQRLVVDLARELHAPGLVIVEAPMGEGKTKAALAAAEILAARFGLDGLFMGMPTQATCDPIFEQVHRWAGEAFGDDVAAQVALLHGKRRFNKLWRQLTEHGGADSDEMFSGVDEYGEPEGAFYGADACCAGERLAPAEWFLGSKRGLLAGLAVGTIDQLLYAATRTRHVMLRFAGLAGKVVVLDEVHAADIYMQQFLAEALFWLGQVGVPVVLLSATLPPRQRKALTEAYLCGALNKPYLSCEELPEPDGYPSVTAAWADAASGSPRYLVRACEPWRDPYPVVVEVLRDAARDPQAVVDLVAHEAVDGGVVLVIHNTVDRAQTTYERLKEHFGADVELLHGRLDVAERADRTDRCVRVLGVGPKGSRPARRILVATQVAEQSFDIDADLLVTDVAPIDLLLQRIGRLHRHARSDRCARFETPRVVVTGLDVSENGPVFEGGTQAIYGRARLLRTTCLVLQAEGGHWALPTQIPELVAAVYEEQVEVPEAWAAIAVADTEWQQDQARRVASAERFLLLRRGERTSPTLGGLHEGDTRADDQQAFEAVVRDGKPTVEVVLVRRREMGGYASLRGSAIGVNGEASPDLIDEVLGGTVRLPSRLTQIAQTLSPLPGWTSDPWLRYARALVLEPDGIARLGDYQLTYDRETGLKVGGGAPHR
jgi:CRISPR-associated endonuclease/helicase Cas3